MVIVDNTLINFVVLCFVALAIGLVLRFLKQPTLIAYILTGLALGPSGFALVTDFKLISQLGNLGVILLLFFIGMQMSIKNIKEEWKLAVIRTLLQILVSVGVVWILGIFLGWGIIMVILLGFVISLSSTTVLIKILESKNLLNKKLGKDVVNILIVQDLALVPMLLIISFLNNALSLDIFVMQVIGTVIVIAFLIVIFMKKKITLPFKNRIRQDHEFQLLAAFVICFGFATFTAYFQLSAALGAFLGGLLLAVSHDTKWIHQSLNSFKVLFVALFFISIGMLIDIEFILTYRRQVAFLVLFVFLINTILNSFIFRSLGERWRNSLYAGALLAQIGELSFVLVGVGLSSAVISRFVYQLTIAVISLSLLLSPVWIALFSKLREDTN